MAKKVVPMIHVPEVRAAAKWYEDIGFTVNRTHEDDGEMSWASLSFGSNELMFNEGALPIGAKSTFTSSSTMLTASIDASRIALTSCRISTTPSMECASSSSATSTDSGLVSYPATP